MPHTFQAAFTSSKDVDLLRYIQAMTDDLKQRMPGVQLTEAIILRELVSRVQVAESQLATMTSIKEPDSDEAVIAARFVLNADVDDVNVYHPDFDTDGDGTLTANDCEEGQNSEQLKQTASLKFVESCRITASVLLERTVALRQVSTALDEMVRRNAALRDRPDLPFNRTAAASRYEAKIRDLTTRSLSCCFCNTPVGTIRELKEHSTSCRFHPLYQAAQTANMPIPSVNMSINELVNLVCEHLPHGFKLDLDMERGAALVRLFDDDYDELQQGNSDMTVGDQITDALNEARSMVNQPPVAVPVNLPQPQPEPMVAPLDQFSNTGWPIHLRTVRLKFGTVGLLVRQIAVRQMLDAGPYRTAVTLFDVIGPAVLLTTFQDQLKGPGARMEVITEDGVTMPVLVGCKADTIGSASVSKNMVVVSVITLVSTSDITDTDWFQHKDGLA